MSGDKLTAFIFARGGSKGVPDKNIRTIAGKPLIAHAIQCGLQSRYISKVIVSTDSDRIAAAAEDHGAEVQMRPAELAADDTPEILAWRYAIEQSDLKDDDLFISLPVTSPLRAPEDVDRAVERFRRGDCDIVFGISPSHRNPYLNMVRIDQNDLIKVAMDGIHAVRRQDVPDIYDITTCVYVTGAAYVMNCQRLIDGRCGYVMIPRERALDIDEEFDLYLADLILTRPFNPSAGE